MATNTAKNFLITGAARGIGRGLSRLLLQQGHRVLLLDNNVEELNHTGSKLETSYKRGRQFATVLCNLRKPQEIKAAVEEVRQLFAGHLDALINNAAVTGTVGAVNLADLTLEDWNASIETNLTAPMLLSQGCLPLLQKSDSRGRGGVIIHMSSTRAFMSEPDHEAYSATKAGLLGLTNAMAVSLAPRGVRVNAILPGWIHVLDECQSADKSGREWEEGLGKEDQRWHLTGRVGRVEDVAKAVEYLVEAEFVTGTEMVVDGGKFRNFPGSWEIC